MRSFSDLRKSRWYRRGLWAAGLFVLYTLVGFFVVPPIIRAQLVKRLPAITRRNAAVREVKVNPLALSLTIRGLELTEPDGRPFAAWEEFYVNFQASSLFRWAWTFDEIRLTKPFGEVILQKDGQLNVANMFTPDTATAPKPTDKPASIPRVQIYHLQITNGFVALEDRTRRSLFRTEYRPINLDLKQFTTTPNSDTPYSFHAESDAGRSISWAGDFSVQPLASSGKLQVTGVRLGRYQPYLEDFTRAVLTNGIADLDLAYKFRAGTNGFDLGVTNGALHVADVQVLDPGTGETVAALVGAHVNGASLDWRSRYVRVESVAIDQATLLARLQPGGHLNLLDLLAPGGATNAPAPVTRAPAPAADSVTAPPWTLAVGEFGITKAAVTAEDLSLRTRFRTVVQPIEVRVENFSTATNTEAAYHFHLATESEEWLDANGTLAVNPVRSRGEISLGGLDLKKYLPYAEAFFHGHVAGGKVDVRCPYDFVRVNGEVQAGVSKAAIQLQDLELKSPDNRESLVRVGRLRLEDMEARLEKRAATIGHVTAEGGSLLVRRDAQGGLNLQQWLALPPTRNAPAAPPKENGTGKTAAAWTAAVREIAFSGYQVTFEDLQPATPATNVLDQVTFTVKGAGTDLARPLEVRAALRFNGTGTLAASGTAQLQPRSAELAVDLEGIDLRGFQSYIDPFIGLGIAHGSLRTHGNVRYQQPDPAQAPHIVFQGQAGITNLLCTDQVLFKEFIRWSDLRIEGIDCELQPNRLKVESVTWVEPRGSLLIGPDRRPNIALILKQPAASETNAVATTAAPAQPAVARAPVPPVEVGTVQLERASFAFTDQSIEPPASIGLQELSGTIKGLSSELNTTAEVNLEGAVDQASPFAIRGKVNPLASHLFVDLTISNANTQLTPTTPYMEKYAGYPLKKGRLSTRLHYLVQDGELKAENSIQIDQLTLGVRNNSPDATSLPIKLGIALLKDSEGRIALDVPVAGRLDDPQFSVAPIVWKVIVNTLVKAASSPFKLLGALVGGGEEMSFVAFEPGSTNIVAGEIDKLGKLTQALQQRPALNLEIEGAIDPATDRQALALQQLRADLKTRRMQELSARGKGPQDADAFSVEPEEFQRLLRAAFAETYGTNTSAALQEYQASLAGAHSPAQPVKVSFWAGARDQGWRALAWVGIGKYAPRSTAEKQLPKAERLALQQATPEVMETLLANKTRVMPEAFQKLMEARTRCVQEWLLQTGGVSADRLLLVAPKPVDGNYRGESRVNLSVE